MTPEEIKDTWAEASRKTFRHSPEDFEEMYREKKETALERLAARYKRFSNFGLAMVVVSALWMFSSLPFATDAGKYISCAMMMVYFATCSILDHWFYSGVSSINCYTMTVSEVIGKAMYYRRKHLQSMMFLFPFVFIVLGALIYAMDTNEYMLLGMGAGALVGLIIGYRQYRQFMSEYKTISHQ